MCHENCDNDRSPPECGTLYTLSGGNTGADDGSAKAENADLVLVMENGEIVQQGTHRSLMEDEEGLYVRLQREAASASS